MKRKVIITIASFILYGTSLAQHIAKYGGEFLALGAGGRALALGGAYVALARDASASYWNPAGLSQIQYPELLLMHEERFAGLVNYDFGAVAIPVGTETSLGFSALRLGVENIADTRLAGVDINGNPVPPDQYSNAVRLDYDKITYFTAAHWAFFITYAIQSNETFSYGFNVKIIRHSIANATALGIGFDAGILYSPLPDVYLGGTIQDGTTTLIAWSTGTNELISPTVKLGVAYCYEIFGGILSPAIDVDIRFENRKTASIGYIGPVSIDPHVGLEFDYKKTIALRVGYSDVRQLTIGAGLHLRKLDIDYAYARFGKENSLGDTHRISLRFMIQEQKYKRE
ncbi:MAG: PorV/PorQ family protein [Bacteroidetes bacterium]|nr:PorV/PorQ family protein [Bacteroidota bacterium]